jgi:dihydroxyacid dehydratase/phosphogluconate dehydratase
MATMRLNIPTVFVSGGPWLPAWLNRLRKRFAGTSASGDAEIRFDLRVQRCGELQAGKISPTI